VGGKSAEDQSCAGFFGRGEACFTSKKTQIQSRVVPADSAPSVTYYGWQKIQAL
jgi:hypothetical protein